MTRTAIAALTLSISLVSTQTANAGLLSLFMSMVGNQQVSADTSSSSTPQDCSQGQSCVLYPISLPPCDASSTMPMASGGEALSAESAKASACGADRVNTSITTYTVQADDNLSIISDMFGVSQATIAQANGLSGRNPVVRPGQQLVILPVDGVLYTVKSGDSVSSIASKFKVSRDDVFAYNDINPSSPAISPGDQLIIPHGSISVSESRTYIASHQKVPSFEPLLDPVWNWAAAPSGYYSCPVPGSVLTQGLHGHNAVDLAIAFGTPIRAAAAGTVIVSKSNGLWNGAYGNFVMLSHGNGSESLYAHMLRTAVSVGDHVDKGQVIGYVGMTGMTTGPHVHFEIRGAQNPFSDPSLCR